MDEKSLRTGDDAAKIIEIYSDMVYRLALARTRDKSNAEDVFQEVFIRYMKNSEKIKSEEHCRAWLIKTTINCSKSIFASTWLRRTVPLDETLPFTAQENSDVYFAVLNLPLKYRTVIHLFYYEDMAIADISRVIAAKESTVKSQLFRARAMLKEMLKGEID